MVGRAHATPEQAECSEIFPEKLGFGLVVNGGKRRNPNPDPHFPPSDCCGLKPVTVPEGLDVVTYKNTRTANGGLP